MTSPHPFHLPGQEPERYVSRRELAELMGVSESTIGRLVRAGMPSETWGVRTRRFRPSLALAWARTIDPEVVKRARQRTAVIVERGES